MQFQIWWKHSCCSERYAKVHDRLKSDKAKDGYVLESLHKRLSVSQNLGIYICMQTLSLCMVTAPFSTLYTSFV